MTAQQVRVVIDVKSENFHQVLEESVGTEESGSYEQLIAANERLKAEVSKIFTEFVNKARQEQDTNGDQKKRKIKRKFCFLFNGKKFCISFFSVDDDDEDENENENEEDDEEPEPSDEEEEEQ
jgi:hypothetical protein